MWYFIILIY